MKEWDINTRFFHKKASQRKKKNFIKGLKDANGILKLNEERDQLILECFRTLFKASVGVGQMDFFERIEG